MGDIRTILDQGMKSSGVFCKPIHIRFGNSAFDFKSLCGEEVPADVFDPKTWTPEEACKKGFIDEGHKTNVTLEDQKKWKDFHLIVSSTFDLAGAEEHLKDKIPHYDKLAIII